jgi:nuclear polyadenylated RNA-binding protein 3
VIQRQILEGVHAVVELDMRAHQFGKIPLQVFDRSAGMNKVRFDQYRDIDPPIAAELVMRTKAQSAQVPQQPNYSGYQQPYGAPAHQPQISPHTTTFPVGQVPGGAHVQQPAVSAAEIAGIVGHIDNATLQRLLASLQAPQAGGAVAPHNPGHMPGSVPPHATPNPNLPTGAANPQVDLQALLGSLKAGAGAQNVPAQGGQAGGYPQQTYQNPNAASAPRPNPVGGSNDAAAQVQNIMAQLARYRQ